MPSFVEKMWRRRGFPLRVLRWHLLRHRHPTLTARTHRQGVFTVYSADRAIGRKVFWNGEYEWDMTVQLMSCLAKLDKLPPKGRGTMLDIGANIGVSSIGIICGGWMERAVAIEPDPNNFALLKQNASQNGLGERVICLQYAASDRKGKVGFEQSEKNFGDHRVRAGAAGSAGGRYGEAGLRVIEVESDTVDHLLENQPRAFVDDLALVWLDTQGHEGQIFRGAPKLFSRDLPVVAEVWPYGIARSGLPLEEYGRIAKGTWGSYWVLRGGRYVQRPMTQFDLLFEELGSEGRFENAIFLK